MNLSRVRHQWNRASRSSNAISIRIFSIFRQGEGSDPSFDSPRLLHTEIIIERFMERSSFSTRERKSKSADDETFEIKIRYSRYVRVYTSIRHRSRFLFVDFGSSTTLEWIGFRKDTRNLLRSKKLISILKKKNSK